MPAACRTKTRRASSSMRPICSTATSSPATTASKAARAPTSASAIPAALGNGYALRAICRPILPAWRAEFLRNGRSGQGWCGIPASKPTRSDYVTMVGIDAPSGHLAQASASRFDEAISTCRRADAAVGYRGHTSADGGDLHQHPGAAALRLHHRPGRNPDGAQHTNSRTTGRSSASVTYDLNSDVITRNGIGMYL